MSRGIRTIRVENGVRDGGVRRRRAGRRGVPPMSRLSGARAAPGRNAKGRMTLGYREEAAVVGGTAIRLSVPRDLRVDLDELGLLLGRQVPKFVVSVAVIKGSHNNGRRGSERVHRAPWRAWRRARRGLQTVPCCQGLGGGAGHRGRARGQLTSPRWWHVGSLGREPGFALPGFKTGKSGKKSDLSQGSQTTCRVTPAHQSAGSNNDTRTHLCPIRPRSYGY